LYKKTISAILAMGLMIQVVLAQSFTSSNLPIIRIDTKGLTILDEPKIVADLVIIDNGPGQRNNLTDKPALTSKIGIEKRGASSQKLFPKKPYGFELRDSAGIEGVSKSVLGLPEEEDWVLNATYNDKTLLREVLTYDLYHRMSNYWATHTRFCEVVLNGDYQGIYILMEKNKRDKNRVPITNLKKTDNTGDAVTGGYLLKIDKTEGAVAKNWYSPYFPTGITKSRVLIQVDNPKVEDITDQQFDYIKKYVTDVETAFTQDNYKDSLSGIRRYIDEDSFVDFLLINEVCRNVDAYRLSSFFYKDRDSKGGKMTMGPIWDFNLTYGNADFCTGDSPEGWVYNFNSYCPTDFYFIPFWWDRLVKDAQFGRRVQAKYQQLRKDVLKTERINAYIDSTVAVLRESRERNFQRWPVIGQKLWPNTFVGKTYEEEVGFLKSWFQKRLEWLDRNMPILAQDVLAVEPQIPGAVFSVQATPNPYAQSVTVNYQIAKTGQVRLQVVDLAGKPVVEVDEKRKSPGTYHLTITIPPAATGLQLLILEVDGIPVGRAKLLQQ
jgi:hypothetical protein